MTHPTQTEQSPNGIPLAVSNAAGEAVQKYAVPPYESRPASAYVHVIEDVDQEDLGKPFEFRLPRRFADQAETDEERERAGRTWRLLNSQALTWQELSNLDSSPAAMLRKLLGDQYDEFDKIKGVQQALMNNIMLAYRKHFALDEPGK